MRRAFSRTLSPALAILGLGAASAEIAINEIHYKGEPNTAANEFVELHNSGLAAVDVSGWYTSASESS